MYANEQLFVDEVKRNYPTIRGQNSWAAKFGNDPTAKKTVLAALSTWLFGRADALSWRASTAQVKAVRRELGIPPS